MKLYDYYRSTASYRVRITLNLKKIHYDSIPIHLVRGGGEQYTPEYRAINPQGLVPTLDENGHTLHQSLAIIEYLEEMNPDPPLLPHNPLARSQVRALAMLIATDIHPLNNLRVLQQLRQQFKASDDAIKVWYHHWLKLGFDALETKLKGIQRKSWVCYGNEITLADICLIPQIYNAKRFNFSIDGYPIIQEINNHCLTLPAFYEAAPDKAKEKAAT